MMNNIGGSILNPKTAVGNFLLINAIIFLAQCMFPRYEAYIYGYFALHYPTSQAFYIWQVFSYMFLHGNIDHIFFNMFALWMFGRRLEYDLGSRRFVIYYVVCGIGAALFNLFVNTLCIAFSPETAMTVMMSETIGASGAVFGILLAYGMFYPNEMLLLLIPPMPIKAKWLVIGYGVIELLAGIRGTDNVAHFAHLGGMIFGFILIQVWKKRQKI